MRIFTSPRHGVHAPESEIKDGQPIPFREHPGRLEAILSTLETGGFPQVEEAMGSHVAVVAHVHDGDYLAFLRSAHDQWLAEGKSGHVLPLLWQGSGMRSDIEPETVTGQIARFCFDVGTPIGAGTYEAAMGAAGAAEMAAAAVVEGERLAYAAVRPPGHHAAAALLGGYCYVNSAAVAAQTIITAGAGRVAILDVDYHHGNGSQDIFYDRPDVLVVNIHADPKWEYPYFLGHADETGQGAGEGVNFNLPLAKGTDWPAYEPALGQALDRVQAFGADALVLSFGGDTFADDPLGQFRLEIDDYGRMGERISRLRLPTAVVQEGGYCVEKLGAIVAALLTGLSGG